MFIDEFSNPGKSREAIEKAYRADETACVETMLNASEIDLAKRKRVQSKARELVEEMRRRTAVWRRGAFRHRPESRRTAISASLRGRAHAVGQHHGRGWKRGLDVA